MEADRPGKLFIGGLSAETTAKSLEAEFQKYGHIVEVLLIKDRNTNKSRGFAFITFQSPADGKDAAREMNGKFLDGKAIKVEQANKPSFESGGRQRQRPSARNRGHPRNQRCQRGRIGGARGRVSRGGHLGDNGYSLNMSSSRGPYPVKRGPSTRCEGPSSKRSAPSAQGRSSSGMRGQGPVLRRENYREGPRGEPVSSRRDDYVSPRDDGYATKDSYSGRDYPSSRDNRDYAPPSRDYAYRDYGHSSSRDDHSSRGHSDRDGYGGSRDRDYSEHRSGGSYKDSYKSYGGSRDAASGGGPPPSYGRSSRYDDYSTARHRYGGGWKSHSSSRSDAHLSGRDHGGRHERGFPSSKDRVYLAPRESYSSSGCEASSKDRVYLAPRESYSSSGCKASSKDGVYLAPPESYSSSGCKASSKDRVYLAPPESYSSSGCEASSKDRVYLAPRESYSSSGCKASSKDRVYLAPRESYSSSGCEASSKDRVYLAPPESYSNSGCEASSKDRVYLAPRESYSSSGCEASSGGHGGSRSERVGRNRY